MRRFAVVLAAALIVIAPGARGADLVVRWEQGYYAQEEEALAEIVAAFEQGTISGPSPRAGWRDRGGPRRSGRA